MVHRISAALMLILGLIISQSTSAQATSYVYAYSHLNEAQELILFTYDPVNSTTNAQTVRSLISAQSNEAINGINLSPDGRWLISYMRDETVDQSFVRLYDLSADVYTDVLQDYRFVSRPVWSPDGQFFAIKADNMAGDLSEVFSEDLILLNLSNQQHVVIADGSTTFVDLFTWGNSDRELIFTGVPPCTQQPCSSSVTIYDPIAMTQTASLSVQSFGDQLCNLHMSPNSEFLLYEFSCGKPFIGLGFEDFVDDLYLWNLSSNAVQRITSFGQTVTSVEEFDRSTVRLSVFAPFWNSTATFFIGYRTEMGPAASPDVSDLMSGTVISDVLGNQTMLGNSFLSGWLASPDGTKVAYYESVPQIDTSSGAPRSIDPAIATHIATFNAVCVKDFETTS